MFSISSCDFSSSPHPFGCLRTYYPAFCLGSGLEILAFPCNQFGAQEPGNNEQILEFACTRFKAEYPIFDKVCDDISVFSYLYS
jgi:glutathione peroxidase-family protein